MPMPMPMLTFMPTPMCCRTAAHCPQRAVATAMESLPFFQLGVELPEGGGEGCSTPRPLSQGSLCKPCPCLRPFRLRSKDSATQLHSQT
eukprot:366044-Chlamydomonas_euryale.AAC.9